MPREWCVSEALKSWRSLNSILHELTVEELEAVLEIETGSKRRSTHIARVKARITILKRN